MIRRLRRRGYDPRTVGGDKGYDVGDFPMRLTTLGIKPHLAMNQHRPPRSRETLVEGGTTPLSTHCRLYPAGIGSANRAGYSPKPAIFISLLGEKGLRPLTLCLWLRRA